MYALILLGRAQIKVLITGDGGKHLSTEDCYFINVCTTF